MGIITFLIMCYLYLALPIAILKGYLCAILFKISYAQSIIYAITLNIISVLIITNLPVKLGILKLTIFNYSIINFTLVVILFLSLCSVDIYIHFRYIKNTFKRNNRIIFIVLYWFCFIMPWSIVQNVPSQVTIAPKEKTYPQGVEVIISSSDLLYSAKSFIDFQPLSSKKLNSYKNISLSTTTYNADCYIVSSPYGGLVFHSLMKNSNNVKLNIQTLFYRWTPAQFFYDSKYNIILFAVEDGNFIYDCQNSQLYMAPFGKILGIKYIKN